MAKIEHDKYYTPTSLAKRLIDKTYEILGEDNITEIIEPSAGNGAFSNQIDGCIAYDLVPEHPSIKQADFLTLPLKYKRGRLFIGNPPFGVHSTLIYSFYKRCVAYGDYIAFILPISFLNNDIKLYKFDLVYSEDLGLAYYTDRDLHCCFNIYKRPKNGINERPDYTLNEITIIEHRRMNEEYPTAGANKHIEPDYDYAMCNWGNVGKRSEYIEQYAHEVYFYCHDSKYKAQMLELLKYETISDYAKSISCTQISVMRLYKYLYENIDGLTLKKPKKTKNKLF